VLFSARARAPARSAALTDRLRDPLSREPADRRVEARGGSVIRNRVLLLDEYLQVRLVAQVVHRDDLVRSVPDLDTSPVLDAAAAIATEMRVAAAVELDGRTAMLRRPHPPDLGTVQALRVL
jgi:hypothetical protein